MTDLRQMIIALCERAMAEQDEFTRLDQELGDGDFGINIARGAATVRSALLRMNAQTDRTQLLIEIGNRLNAAGCGTSGTLLSFGISAAAMRSQDLFNFLNVALARIQGAGEAQPGDRTMVDALAPAVEILRGGGSLAQAAKAARQGADATRQMLGKRGRALYRQSRSLGVPDPGAELIAILFEQAIACQEQGGVDD